MEEVFSKVERHVIVDFELFGFKFELSSTLAVTICICVAIIIVAAFLTRGLKSDGVPSKLQCTLELLTEFVTNLCKTSAGHHGTAFVPYIGTLLVFLCVVNISALFNFLGFGFFEIHPPSKDINFTGAMAVTSLLVVLYAGFRYKGFKGWAKGLCEPMPLMAPFKIMEYITKPMSLCLRLFGNIFAGWIIMELLYAFLPIAASPFSAYFDIFDGILQGYIFAYLTIVYIGEAVE